MGIGIAATAVALAVTIMPRVSRQFKTQLETGELTVRTGDGYTVTPEPSTLSVVVGATVTGKVIVQGLTVGADSVRAALETGVFREDYVQPIPNASASWSPANVVLTPRQPWGAFEITVATTTDTPPGEYLLPFNVVITYPDGEGRVFPVAFVVNVFGGTSNAIVGNPGARPMVPVAVSAGPFPALRLAGFAADPDKFHIDITSRPAGIQCTVTEIGADGECRNNFPQGQLVTLTARSADLLSREVWECFTGPFFFPFARSLTNEITFAPQGQNDCAYRFEIQKDGTP